ncbi:MAG: aminopeptidase P family protein [Holosporales bacterium]
MSHQNLVILRHHLKTLGLQGLIVTKADAHQNEYVPAHLDRLQWLSGFTGSAGTAVITAEDAVLFVDGRYTVQAEAQSGACFQVHTTPTSQLSLWLGAHLQPGHVWGVDGTTLTARQGEQIEEILKNQKCTLENLPQNPIDTLWKDRPHVNLGPIVDHPVTFSGQDWQGKVQACVRDLHTKGLDAALISTCEGVAWLMNWRGTDVPFTPVAFAFCVVEASGGVHLFVDAHRLEAPIQQRLEGQVTYHAYGGLEAFFKGRGGYQRVLLDHASAPYGVAKILRKQNTELVYDSCVTLIHRARKNLKEQQGIRQAHLRDGAALCQALAWLKIQDMETQEVSELDVVQRLLDERRKQPHFQQPSFGTIVGSGPHGAIIHYQPTLESNRRLRPQDVIVIDSGGQYLDGTTDVTRTVVVGEGTEEAKKAFTRTLKGHIRLAKAIFPQGTTGAQLDSLARYDLWQDCKDYAHGTGHGIGAYLHVHEGPHNIGSRPNGTALEPGMIVSNEPGYYARDAFGIRIESVIMVQALDDAARWLSFETITLAPIDQDLIDRALLTAEETAWLNAYHARVYDCVAPLVDVTTRDWLQQATKPMPLPEAPWHDGPKAA